MVCIKRTISPAQPPFNLRFWLFLVLKILQVSNDGVFTEIDNLRPTGKMNLSYSTVDVQWHPTDRM